MYNNVTADRVRSASDRRDLTRVITEHAADAIFMMDMSGRVTFMNPAAERMFGWSQQDLLGQVLHDVLHHHHPDGRPYPRETCVIAQAYRTGQTLVGLEDMFFHKDGSPVHVSCSNAPVLDGGDVVSSVLTVQDISERKRSEAALRESEAFVRSVLESSPDCVKVIDLEGRLIYMNGPGLCVMEVDDLASIKGQAWTSLWPAEAADQIRQAVADAKQGRTTRFSAYCPTAKGTPKWWEVTVSPIFEDSGRVKSLLSISRDVTERSEAEERQHLMTRELHHRVKNTLATVQAVISSTARQARSINEFYQAVSSRIISLARTHTLLVNNTWGGATVEDLFRAELEAYDDRGRIDLEGPPVRLPPELSLALGMAAHELTTNAAKYGALSLPDGTVRVRWALAEGDERSLDLDWIEENGPPVETPTRKGFGSMLLERVLGRQLNGQVTIDYAPGGLRLHLRAPLVDGYSTQTA